MDCLQSTTDMPRRKWAHLTFAERVIIQTRRKDKWSLRRIARELGCAVNTVRNEVRRGNILLYNGKVERYRAEDGQAAYDANRKNCGRKCDALRKGRFLDYVDKRFQENHWSFDACVGRALAEGLFGREDIVCTKTLYNYVTMGLLGKIKSIDLPLRVRRKNKKKHTQERKKKLGRSIEERDPSIEERQEFGHWECDLVLGARSKDEVLLILVERKTAEPYSGSSATRRAPPSSKPSASSGRKRCSMTASIRCSGHSPPTTAASSHASPNWKRRTPCACTTLIPIAPARRGRTRTTTGCSAASSQRESGWRTIRLGTSLVSRNGRTPFRERSSATAPRKSALKKNCRLSAPHKDSLGVQLIIAIYALFMTRFLILFLEMEVVNFKCPTIFRYCGHNIPRCAIRHMNIYIKPYIYFGSR